MCTSCHFDSVPVRYLFLFICGFFLTACGVANQPRPTPDNTRNASRISAVQSALHQAYNDWKGTPYVLGGSGIGGVDCSSFTQIVLQDYFGIDLPRNTREQIQVGSSVRRNYMRPGDLVFFRTGRNLLHVGIVLEGDQFLHASVSSGVMISNLSQRYWATKYLATRRIL